MIDEKYEATPPWELGRDRTFEVDYGKMTTYPGLHYIDPFNPDPGAIDIRDIAHALAFTCRYAGHIPVHYSVAQHSIIVASCFSGPEARLVGLLHDAEEAYLGDMVSPVKKWFPEYKAAGKRCRDAIFAKFGLLCAAERWHDRVKEMDNEVYTLERRFLWRGPITDTRFVPLDMNDVEAYYLGLFHQLQEDLYAS